MLFADLKDVNFVAHWINLNASTHRHNSYDLVAIINKAYIQTLTRVAENKQYTYEDIER